MIQKTKKRLAFVFGALVMSLFGGVAHKNFDKDAALFTGVNVAHADVPGSNPLVNYDGGGCDCGCSGCDSY